MQRQPRATRRDLIVSAVVGGAVAGGAGSALAQSRPAPVWSGDYWAKKGEVSLYMFRKRVGAPRPGVGDKPVIVLVHGSTVSSRSSYDLVGRNIDLSLMDFLARAGFDVWTLDHEGYGRSTVTRGNSDIASGADDLQAGLGVIRRETGRARVHMYGESSGGLRAGLFANRHPEAIDRLILGAFTYTGVGAPTIQERAKRLDQWRASPRRPRDRAMLEGIFTRDGLPIPRDVIDLLIEREASYGDTVPSGTYVDMTSRLPLVDPKTIRGPLLMIRGQGDGNSTLDDLLDFYRQVPSANKQFVTVPGAHALTSGPHYRQVWQEMEAFLKAPIDPA